MAESIPLSFESGMDESQESSQLGEGSASLIENWIPEPTGGLRCRRGWLNASTTGAPATRKTKSLGFFQIAQSVETPARVQAAQNTSSSVGIAVDATWPAATTIGNLLVLIVGYQLNGAVGAITVPAGWTLAASDVTGNTAGHMGIRLYYKANAASESGAVSVTIGNATASVQIAEYSGVERTSPLDQVDTNLGTPASATPNAGPTPATTQNKELWIAGFADARNEAMSAPTNSFSIVQQQTDLTPKSSGMLERIVTSTGTASTQVTTATSDLWAGVMATFKARNISSANYVIAAHDNTTSYDLYYKDANDLTTGSWTSIESVTSTSTSPSVAFAVGLGQLVYTNAKFTTIRRWNGTDAAASITDGPPGRTIAFHKNRFFTGGTETNPTRLWYSDLGSYSTWPATSYIDIGQDDGETILDLAVFEEGLLIAKENSLWFLSGSGPNDFTVHQLNAGGGYNGRCIGVTPYGAVIAGENHIWMWAGGGVDLISKPVEESYGLAGNYVSVAYLDGVAYICDESSTTMFCLDMQRGAWWLEKTSDSAGGPAYVASKAGALYYGPKSSIVRSLAVYREIPGTARQRDVGLDQTFKAHTPEIWPVDPGHAFTPLRLYVKYRQRGGDATQTGITVTPVTNGVDQPTATITPQASAGTYRVALDVNKGERGINSIQFRFEQTVPSTEAALIDLEEVLFEYDHVQRRTR